MPAVQGQFAISTHYRQLHLITLSKIEHITAIYGIHIPMDVSAFGIPITERIMPVFSFLSILKTILLIIGITAMISYFPVKKIAHLHPTDAIRGKAL